MFLFTILALIALFLIVFVVFAISAGGAIFTIVFGDVIICILLIGVLIWFLFFRK